MLDGLAVMAAGDQAAMTQAEKSMIEPPLSRMMERLDKASSEAVQKYGDPIMLGFGLFMWVSRVYRMRAEAADQPPADQPPAEPMTQNEADQIVTDIDNAVTPMGVPMTIVQQLDSEL